MRTVAVRVMLSVTVAVASGGCSLFGIPSGALREAQWAPDPAFEVTAEATEIPLLVGEVACASGRDATGRIEIEVAYEPDEVVVIAYVRELGGDQTCQGNPVTPYELVLDEPVGGRRLVNGATDEIARRPLEIGDDNRP